MSESARHFDTEPTERAPEVWLAALFRRLAEATASPEDPFRTPVLATIDAQGGPAARQVVLREMVPATARLSAWTDARSAKCAEIEASDRVAWLFWDPVRRVQLRFSGRAELIRSGPRCEATWAGISTTRRREYLAIVAPGAMLDADSDRPAAPAFAIIDSWVDQADLLQLDRRGHRRARLRREADGCWRGAWVEP